MPGETTKCSCGLTTGHLVIAIEGYRSRSGVGGTRGATSSIVSMVIDIQKTQRARGQIRELTSRGDYQLQGFMVPRVSLSAASRPILLAVRSVVHPTSGSLKRSGVPFHGIERDAHGPGSVREQWSETPGGFDLIVEIAEEAVERIGVTPAIALRSRFLSGATLDRGPGPEATIWFNAAKSRSRRRATPASIDGNDWRRRTIEISAPPRDVVGVSETRLDWVAGAVHRLLSRVPDGYRCPRRGTRRHCTEAFPPERDRLFWLGTAPAQTTVADRSIWRARSGLSA